MLTEYDIQQQARERSNVYAFENDTRRRARLSAERSKREAGKREAYIAERLRHKAAAAVADIQDIGCDNPRCGACSIERSIARQARPFDWEQDRRTEFALNGPTQGRRWR